jgi:hypothetical protein
MRFCEHARLLPPPLRTACGYRDYGPDTVWNSCSTMLRKGAPTEHDNSRFWKAISSNLTPPRRHVV